MFVKKSFAATVGVVACLLAFSVSVWACACCAETGTYHLRTDRPSDYEREILEKIQFDRDAYLYMTEAGFDLIKGLDPLRKAYESESWTAAPEYFRAENALVNKKWKLNFFTRDGQSGALVLPMPVQMLSYKVDIHDGSDRGLGPMLYKEWRFKGTVERGDGFFRSGIARPTSYFLVFQGRGRGCDDIADFGYWRLEITGPKANYSFFGRLASGDKTRFAEEQEGEDAEPNRN